MPFLYTTFWRPLDWKVLFKIIQDSLYNLLFTVGISCPAGWSVSDSKSTCLKPFWEERKYYFSAEVHCQSLGGTLARLRDQNSIEDLQKLAPNEKATHKVNAFWIGYYYLKTSQHELIKDSDDRPPGITIPWFPGHPKVTDERQCLLMNNGLVSTSDCSKPLHGNAYVCEWRPG